MTSPPDSYSAQDVAAMLDRAAEALHALPTDLNMHAITSRLEALRGDVGQLVEARAVLDDGLPLADHFPAGNPVPKTPTPRQVLLLHQIGRDERAEELRSRFGAPVGPCEATASTTGRPCQNLRLAYVHDRAVCQTHARPSELRTHRAARDRVEELACAPWANGEALPHGEGTSSG